MCVNLHIQKKMIKNAHTDKVTGNNCWYVFCSTLVWRCEVDTTLSGIYSDIFDAQTLNAEYYKTDSSVISSPWQPKIEKHIFLKGGADEGWFDTNKELPLFIRPHQTCCPCVCMCVGLCLWKTGVLLSVSVGGCLVPLAHMYSTCTICFSVCCAQVFPSQLWV